MYNKCYLLLLLRRDGGKEGRGIIKIWLILIVTLKSQSCILRDCGREIFLRRHVTFLLHNPSITVFQRPLNWNLLEEGETSLFECRCLWGSALRKENAQLALTRSVPVRWSPDGASQPGSLGAQFNTQIRKCTEALYSWHGHMVQIKWHALNY